MCFGNKNDLKCRRAGKAIRTTEQKKKKQRRKQKPKQNSGAGAQVRDEIIPTLGVNLQVDVAKGSHGNRHEEQHFLDTSNARVKEGGPGGCLEENSVSKEKSPSPTWNGDGETRVCQSESISARGGHPLGNG